MANAYKADRDLLTWRDNGVSSRPRGNSAYYSTRWHDRPGLTPTRLWPRPLNETEEVSK